MGGSLSSFGSFLSGERMVHRVVVGEILELLFVHDDSLNSFGAVALVDRVGIAAGVVVGDDLDAIAAVMRMRLLRLLLLKVQFEIDLVDYQIRREGEGSSCSRLFVSPVAVVDRPRRAWRRERRR